MRHGTEPASGRGLVAALALALGTLAACAPIARQAAPATAAHAAETAGTARAAGTSGGVAGAGAAATGQPAVAGRGGTAGRGGPAGGPAAALQPSAAAGPSVKTRLRTIRSTVPPYTATLREPELVWKGHPNRVRSVDAEIAAWAAGRVHAFAARVARDLRNARGLPASPPPSDLTLTFQAARIDSGVASFRFVLESHLSGQADETQTPAGLTFDLTSGRRYRLAALFRPGTDYLSVLARASLAGLRNFRPAGARCYVGPGGPAATGASFRAWTLAPAGLRLSFPAGLYTAAYCGPPTVTVPDAALESLAAPGSPLAPHGGSPGRG